MSTSLYDLVWGFPFLGFIAPLALLAFAGPRSFVRRSKANVWVVAGLLSLVFGVVLAVVGGAHQARHGGYDSRTDPEYLMIGALAVGVLLLPSTIMIASLQAAGESVARQTTSALIVGFLWLVPMAFVVAIWVGCALTGECL
jgi:hypothetical protein